MDKPKNGVTRRGFIPYCTMFKLESRPNGRMAIDPKPRGLQCENCGDLLEWRIYTMGTRQFDSECPICHMTAREFWKSKVHRKVETNG